MRYAQVTAYSGQLTVRVECLSASATGGRRRPTVRANCWLLTVGCRLWAHARRSRS